MSATKPSKPRTFHFADDGTIPNNPNIPFVVYRSAVNLAGTADPEIVIERVFAAAGWGDMWRNGIYPYPHYHSMIHEAMAVARGRAKVRFGGEQGEVIDMMPGDIAVLPAGTGHQCMWASPDLMVIGAYPKNGRYDLCRGSKADHARALESIPRVPLPDSDPVYGKNGPLIGLWRT
jgi:uncharacterized protein YjlB